MRPGKKRLGGQTAIVFGSTLLVNAGNYLLNLYLARISDPSAFGPLVLIANIVLALSFLGIGFQLTTTHTVASSGGNSSVQYLKKLSVFSGLFVGLLIAAFSGVIGELLQISQTVIWLLAVGAPVYLYMSVNRGVFQGTQDFSGLSLTYILEMLTRVSITIFLVLMFPQVELQFAVGVGYLVSFATPLLKRSKRFQETGILKVRSMVHQLAMVSGYELTQIMINHSDVFLVQHFIGGETSGHYAAIALVGKVVFFASWSMASVMYPKITSLRQNGGSYIPVFMKTLGFVALSGVIIIVACYALQTQLINLLFGRAYLDAAPFLPLYAIATVLFSLANVFAYFYLSGTSSKLMLVSVLVSVAQIAGIVVFHNHLIQVLVVQIAVMAAYLIVLMTYFSYSEREALRVYARSSNLWKWRRYQSTISSIGKEAAA